MTYRPGEDTGVGRGYELTQQQRRPTVGPNYVPEYSAQLARMILDDDLPNVYRPAWYETQGRYNLPELWGPEATARYRQLAYLAGQNPSADPVQQGFPERVSVTLPWTQQPQQQNPINDAMGNLLGPGTSLGAFVGAGAPRTPSVDFFGVPLATTPLTLTNFSAYGREGVFALVDSILGNNYQTPDDAMWGDDNEGPVNKGPLDVLIDAFKMPFDGINAAFEGAMDFWLMSNAESRALSVRELARTGQVTPFLIDGISSFVTGGAAKFNEEQIQAVADQRNVPYDEMVAEYYDLDPEIVRSIFLNPGIDNAALTALLREKSGGLPPALSRNPAVNMGLELAMQGALLIVPFAGIPGTGIKGISQIVAGATRLGQVSESAGFLRGLTMAERAYKGTQEASGLARAAQVAGWGTRRALQVNSINTTAGWSIRGFEWAVKQVGLMTGNDGLVDMADQMLWNMPLSMNPGFNLVTAFGSHPLEALGINTRLSRRPVGRGRSGLLGGSVLVGTPGTLGWVGEINIAGKPYHLSPAGQQFVGHLASQTFDDLRPFFDHLGPHFADQIEAAIAPGNVDGLTLDHVKNELLHVALTAHRDSLGDLAWAQGLALPTLEERALRFVDEGLGVEEAAEAAAREAGEEAADLIARSREFSKNNIAPAHRLFQQELAGQGTAISDAIRGRYWEYAQLNDSQMSRVKARLSAEFDDIQGAIDFVSAMKANGFIRQAYELQWVGADTAAVLRKSVNIDYLRSFRERLEQLYPDPKEVVDIRQLDTLKRMGGLIEAHPGGNLLVRKGKKPPPPMSRAKVQKIIDQIINDEIVRRDAMAAPPRTEAAVFPKGVDPDAAVADPVQVQRALGLTTEDVEAIRAAQALDEAQLATTPIPRQVAQRVAEALHVTPDDLAVDPQRWQKVFDWFEGKIGEAVDTAKVRNSLDGFARVLDERAAGSTGDPNVITFGKKAVEITRDYLLNPVTREWLRENTSMATRLTEADAVLRTIQKDIVDNLAVDPHRRMKMYTPPDGVAYVMPANTIEAQMVDLLRVIEKVAADGRVPEGELGVLTDPLLHPWLKLDMLRRAELTPEERAIVEQLTLDDLGAVVKDVLGPEAEATPETVAQITAGRSTWEGKVDEAAGQLHAVGARYALVDGKGHNAETRDVLYRLDELQARTGNRWREMRMSTAERPTPEQARATVMEPLKRNEAQRAVERAAEEVRLAQREIDNLRENDLETVWDEQPLFLRRGGKAGAAARAKEINQATGRPTKVVPRYKPGSKAVVGYDVYTGNRVPRTQAIEQKMQAGEVAESQALNIEEGVARGGTPESGGAVLPSTGIFPDIGRRVDLDAMRAEAAPEAPGEAIAPEVAEGTALERAGFREAPEADVDAALANVERIFSQASTGNAEKAVYDYIVQASQRTVEEGYSLASIEVAKALLRQYRGKSTRMPPVLRRLILGEGASKVGADELANLRQSLVDDLQARFSEVAPEAEAPARTQGELPGQGAADAEAAMDEALVNADRDPDVEPFAGPTVDAQDIIVAGGSASGSNVPFAAADQPAFTIKATPGEPIRALIRGENASSMRPLAPDEPAGTITAGGREGGKPKNGWRMLEGARVVRVTKRALARLQGIPDSYQLPESEALARTIIGNGVPPPMMKALVEPLLPFMGKQPHGVTLFSGGGIAEIGLKDSIKFRGAVEYNPDIAAVHTLNHPESAMQNVDVREAQFSQYQGIDYLHASPVCKNFSNAKAQRGEVELDIVTAEATARAINVMKPNVVTVENVPKYQGSEALKVITDQLDKGGYTWDINVFDAADFGVPQHRQRMILRAVKGKNVELPPLPEKQPHVGWWDAIKDLDLPDDPKGLAPWQVRRLEAAGVKLPDMSGAPQDVPVQTYGTATDFPIPGDETTRVPARFRLMEISDVRVDTDKGYPKAKLQPRERKGTRSDAQINRIKTEFDPQLALRSESGSHGTAVVDPAGNTITANGRTRAMREMSDKKWAEYKEALAKRAGEFGLTRDQVLAMDKPVLVREVAEEAATHELAVALNAETGMDALEQARALADDITPEDIEALELGEKTPLKAALGAKRNEAFVDRLLERVPQSETRLRDADRGLNDEGRRLIETAMFQKVLRDPDGEVLGELMNNDEYLSVRNGLLDATGHLAQVEGAVNRGELGESLADTLRGALLEFRSLAELKQNPWTEGRPISMSYYGQLAADLGYALYQLGGGRWGSRSGIAEFFRRYANAAMEQRINNEGAGLFGDAPEPMGDLVRRSIKTAINEMNNIRRAKGVTDEIAQVAEPDGTITQTFTTTGGAEAIARDVPVFGTPDEAIAARMGPSQRLSLTGDPLDPASYAGMAGAGEVRFHVPGGERHAKALQAMYDSPESALGEYNHLRRLEPRGTSRAERIEASSRDTTVLFASAMDRVNSGNPRPADYLVLTALSDGGFLRFNEAGEFNGSFNGLYELPPARDLAHIPSGRIRATHEPPTDLTPADAAILDSTVKDTAPFAAGDPDLAASVDLTPEKVTTQGAIDSGAHIFVPRGSAYDNAARDITGASKGNPPDMVLEINEPEMATMLRLAQERLEVAQAAQRSAESTLEGLGPAPEAKAARPSTIEPLPPEVQELLIDYTQAPDKGNKALRYFNSDKLVTTLGQAMDVIESIDQGVPSLGAPMSEADLAKLREGLMQWVQRRTGTEAGILPGAEQRAVDAIERKRIRGTVIDSPEDWHDAVVEGWRGLEHAVKNDDALITGWEGTQYDLGHLPLLDPDGRPLTPRVLSTEDLLALLNKVSPDVPNELVMGRKQDLPSRFSTARLAAHARGWMPDRNSKIGKVTDLIAAQVRANPERGLREATMERYKDELVGEQPTRGELEVDADEVLKRWQKERDEAAGTISAIHELMTDPTNLSVGGRFRKYRNEWLVGPQGFDNTIRKHLVGDNARTEWGKKFVADGTISEEAVPHLPEWAVNFIENSDSPTPFWDAWTKSENRIRAWFSEQDNAVARYVEALYARPGARKIARKRAGLVQTYHYVRFLLDARWMGLEIIEAPTLTFFRDGVGATLDAMGVEWSGLKPQRTGKFAKPLFMGLDDLSKSRADFAWWMANDYVGGTGAKLRYREAYLLSQVKRAQVDEFPKIMLNMAKEDASLAKVLREMGDTPDEWLNALNDSWELMSSLSHKIDVDTARRVYEPRLADGTINQAEFDKLLKNAASDGYHYVKIPAFEREIAAAVGNPVLAPLMERLKFLNEQAWNDAAQMVFGQTNRSNVQRFLNHPLLYWPISYQIKATKWLATLLFDRFMGVDTGSAGAFLIDKLHAEHVAAAQSDPDYQKWMQDTETLRFVAQMLLPITPFDIGVGLSPFTRLAMGTATGMFDDKEGGAEYNRNLFGFGPGYTYFELLPRLGYELRKSDSEAGQGVGEVIGTYAPFRVTVGGTRSQKGQSERRVYGPGDLPPAEDFIAPPQRLQE